MARSYKRDARGRFASTGGGGKPKSAPTSTRGKNKATTERFRDIGQTGVGDRLKKSTAAKYSGTAATKKKWGQSWANAGHNRNIATNEANYSKSKLSSVLSRRKRG